MPESKYKRKMLLSAVQVLKCLGHSGYNALLLELLPPDAGVGQQGSLMDKANSLAAYALLDQTQVTVEDTNLWDEIVDRAIFEHNRYPDHVQVANVSRRERDDFQASLEAAGLPGSPPEKPSLFAGFPAAAIRKPVGTITQPNMKPPESNQMTEVKPHRVFVVHGRDLAPKHEVARYIESLGFEAFILHERINNGKTIIEKFIANSDVQFAVILLTPDDVGGLVGESTEPRARQNVILEWGYFIGALGREKVMALMKGTVQLPTDVLGLVWVPIDDQSAWKQKLAGEMEAVGFEIDWKKARI